MMIMQACVTCLAPGSHTIMLRMGFYAAACCGLRAPHQWNGWMHQYAMCTQTMEHILEYLFEHCLLSQQLALAGFRAKAAACILTFKCVTQMLLTGDSPLLTFSTVSLFHVVFSCGGQFMEFARVVYFVW